MENFYWAQMRRWHRPPTGGGLLDNSGPWQVLTPWPNAWWNLNVQLSYWSYTHPTGWNWACRLVDAIGNNLDNPDKQRSRTLPERCRRTARSHRLYPDGATVNVPEPKESSR